MLNKRVFLSPVIGMSILMSACSNNAHTYVTGLGYVPVIPPNKLAVPGALYVIEDDQKNPNKVCSIRNLSIESFDSPTEDVKKDLQSKGSVSFSAEAINKLNAILGANYVSSVSLTVTDAKVTQVTEGELRRIRFELLRNPDCNDVVTEFIKSGKPVCQGREILRLTTRYEVNSSFDLSLSASAKDEYIKKLGAELGGEAMIGPTGTVTVRSGTDLIYGIKMSRLCIYLPQDKKIREFNLAAQTE